MRTVKWFPMRIAYGREERVLRIKHFLDKLSVENFLPMQRRAEEVNGRVKNRLHPAINNLIFIHSTQDIITELKNSQSILFPLRYMMLYPHDNEFPSIINVPDYQMQSFILATSVQDDRIMYLGNKDFSHKIGRKVRIIDGIFKGVEGIIYRVKKDRRVVVSIPGVTSVAISYISPALLEEIKED